MNLVHFVLLIVDRCPIKSLAMIISCALKFTNFELDSSSDFLYRVLSGFRLVSVLGIPDLSQWRTSHDHYPQNHRANDYRYCTDIFKPGCPDSYRNRKSIQLRDAIPPNGPGSRGLFTSRHTTGGQSGTMGFQYSGVDLFNARLG